MNAQLAVSAGQQDRLFRVLQDEAVQFVCEILFAAESASLDELDRALQDAVLENLGGYLEALRPAGQAPQDCLEQLAWFETMLMAKGGRPEQVARLNEALAAFLEKREMPDAQAIAAILRKSPAPGRGVRPQDGLARPSVAWPETSLFEAMLLDGDERQAVAQLDASLARGDTLLDFEMHVIQPALYSVGSKWQANTISIAQERLATETALRVMAVGAQRTPAAEPAGRRIVLACVAGNQHAVGVRMVGDAFCAAGWAVDCLGADVPCAALVDYVTRRNPDVIGLSVALAHHLHALRATAEQLITAFGSRRPGLIAGGLALQDMSPMSDISGVDLFGVDARHAVAHATRLCRMLE